MLVRTPSIRPNAAAEIHLFTASVADVAKVGKGIVSFNIRLFSRTFLLILLKSFLSDVLCSNRGLSITRLGDWSPMAVKNASPFFLFSYTPHLFQGYNGLPCYHAPYSVVIPFHLSQGYNAVCRRFSSRTVVVPYYLSQGYNCTYHHPQCFAVVVPYSLSQGYNNIKELCYDPYVVVPYYLSQGYNLHTENMQLYTVVVPYYLSQGYNI